MGAHVADGAQTREIDDATLSFEYDDGPFGISPGLARVLLRVMRKAAERRGIDLNDIEGQEHLAS
jgi:hypothetical protein